MAFRNKSHKYFETHHEECLARSRAWKAKNKGRHRDYMRDYMRRRHGSRPRPIVAHVVRPQPAKAMAKRFKVVSKPYKAQTKVKAVQALESGNALGTLAALRMIDMMMRD